MSISLRQISSLVLNGAEIGAYDPGTQRVFVTGDVAGIPAVQVVDYSNPTAPALLQSLEFPGFDGVTSVAVSQGLLAVALVAPITTDPGTVKFFDTNTLVELKQVNVGSLPDMVTFTPDGTKVLTANEGEPDGGVNPEGSISVIDISSGVQNASVTLADFNTFDDQKVALQAEGVRLFGEGGTATVSQDVEPEYITVNGDSTKAYISLQENNAIAVLDLTTSTITDIFPLGVKDHSQLGNGLDASDQDGGINIQTWPVFGLPMPDAIATYKAGGVDYIVTANEGDARDEDARVGSLTLDSTAFPDAAILQENANLGRLEVSTVDGDPDNDGEFEQLFSYGTRSFSIYDSAGNRVFDSGDDFEQITASLSPADFNTDNDENDFDSRSDAKGPEPEGVVIGEIEGQVYAFVGLERIGGVMVYNITDPTSVEFIQYINPRDFSGDPELGTAGDLGPEGLAFIAAADSPTGNPLLIVTNEVSGTLSTYEIGGNSPLISEFQPNPDGVDPVNQTVELSGAPGAVFSGWLISIESDSGNPGPVDRASAVSGIFDANGLLTVEIPDLENPSFTVVLSSEFNGAVGDDLDADDDGSVDDSSIFGTVFDAIGVPDAVGDEAFLYGADLGGTDFAYTGAEPELIFRDGSTGDLYAVNDVFSGTEVFNTSGADVTPAIFDTNPIVENTFGAINPTVTEPAVGSPGDGIAIVRIFDIQGAAHTSPLLGQTVATTGIVTAVDTNGFYLQDATGDENIATSDALFVFTGNAPGVAIGDELKVEGTVSENTPGGPATRNLSTTEIITPTITVLSSGNPLPDAVMIGASGRIPPSENIDDDAFGDFDPVNDGIDFFESLEGMRVTAKDVVAVSGTNQFGEIFGVVDGGNDATGLSTRGTLSISPDDFNPEKIQIDQDSGLFDFDFPDVNVGAQLGDVTGVIGYGFGNFEILPTEDFTGQIVASALTPESSTLAGAENQLTIASYNVLNLDPNDSDGDMDVADGRFEAIATHVVANLNEPDIIGLQEIQDNSGSVDDGVISASTTLQTLVAAIVAAGGPTYEFIDNTFITNNASGGQPGGNIRTAFLYNPERVDLLENSVQTISGQGEGEAFAGARLPLIADFEFNEQTVTVVNNHFSSKGGSAPIFGVEQPFEARQEDITVNGSLDERQAQSAAVQGFVSTLLGTDADANIVVLGDLNEFEFVSPVTGLEGAGLTNLTNTLPENERYSFIFQGNSQSLDHILVSDHLSDNAEFDIVHTNVEFAETSSRASDHDPLLTRLDFSMPDAIFTLELLHIADQEAAAGAIGDAPRLSAVMNALEAQDLGNDGIADNTLRLSSGDAFIPGLFYDASEAVFGSAGIADIQIQNELRLQAIAFGNHEFDFGTEVLAGLIDGSAPGDFSALTGSTLEGLDFTGTNFPYLSTNLDFSTDANLAPLEIVGGQAPQRNVVTSSTVISMPANGAAMADGENGYTVTPIFTVTETLTGTTGALNSSTAGDYAPPGILDGLGAYELDADTVRVFANHELTDGDGYAYTLANGVSLTGARISYFDIDKTTKQIVDSGLAYDTLYNPDGTVLDDVSDLVEGRNGLTRFCSGILHEAEQFGSGNGLADRIYFAGEETGGSSTGVSGNEWALDVATGELWAVPAMGRGAWENITEVDTGTTTHVAFILMDDTSPFDADGDEVKEAAPMFLYVGEKHSTGDFLERNGLKDGKLYVWVADDPNIKDPSDYNGGLNNVPQLGTWVEIDNAQNLSQVSEDGSTGFDKYGYPTQQNLWTQAEAVGAFGFSRPEDAATNPADGSEFVFASTGRSSDFGGADQLGTLYTAKLDFADINAPTATVEILYDGDHDPTQALRSPDNLDWADDGHIYVQEDRAVGGIFGPGAVNPFDASILKVDPSTGAVTRVAEINQDVTRGAVDENVAATGQQDIGDWESSGILDVSTLFGEDPGSLFLFDVQAHALDDQDRFPEVNGTPAARLTDDDLKEGGQLAFLSRDADLGKAAEKIGVIGATTPTIDIISSPGDVGIAPMDFDVSPTPAQLDALAAEIQLEVDALLAANPGMNKVVLLAHMQQLNIERELATRLENVDIIVGGGSNTRLFDDNDRPRLGDSDQGQYPEFITNAGGTKTALVNTDGSYKYVGRLVLDFDAEGNIIPESYDETVSGAYATDPQGVADLGAEGLIDPEIQAIVDAIEAQILETEGNVFGISNVFLNGNRSGVETPDDPDGVRTQETNLGNLTADANLAIAKEFDPSVVLSIKNGGGIRASIGQTIVPAGGTGAVRLPNESVVDGEGNVVKPEGGISQNDIQTTLAFNNGLTLLTLTKAELIAVLEHGVGSIPNAAGRFPQISGVKFSYDSALPAGDRLINAGIFDEDGNLIAELVRDGEIVGDPTETFRIVTLGFLAGGGDGFPFPTGESANRVDLDDLNNDGVDDNVLTGNATFTADGKEQDALAEYLADNFNTAETAFDQADTGRNLDERIQNVNFRNDTVFENPDPILGTRPGVLNGTALDDTIIGGRGTQIMRGMGGNNTYVYNSLRDGGDRIIDFEVGQDIIDVSQLLADDTSFSAGDNLEDFIKIRTLGSNTVVGIDPDGMGPSRGFLNFIRLQGVSELGLDSFIAEVAALP